MLSTVLEGLKLPIHADSQVARLHREIRLRDAWFAVVALSLLTRGRLVLLAVRVSHDSTLDLCLHRLSAVPVKYALVLLMKPLHKLEMLRLQLDVRVVTAVLHGLDGLDVAELRMLALSAHLLGVLALGAEVP